MRSKQYGYTVIELVIVVGFALVVVGIGAIIYVGGHFLAKVW